MKIQCSVCDAAKAAVLCCADEAALCRSCDEKVHAANKLASKHQRVSLSQSASQMPKCDICQESVGYFFCLEDRALLCRKCDVAIHTANTYVSAHRRFLLTGVKVGLEPAEPGPSSHEGKSLSEEKPLEPETRSAPKRSAPMSAVGEYDNVASIQSGVSDSVPMSEYNGVEPYQGSVFGDLASSRLSFAGGSAAESISQWHIDEFLGLTEFSQNYGYMDNGSSKFGNGWSQADSGKLGESDSSLPRGLEDDLDSDECLGQVPDVAWAVPQIPSPPTASGLYWPKSAQQLAETSVFVPDICWSPSQSSLHCPPNRHSGKRRRQF